MDIKTWSMDWAGKKLTVETGRIARLAHGSCTVSYGDTVILATAIMSKNTREGMDWFPLSVDFEEKLYAAGKIKGSRFIKREGRPSDEAILTGRIVDRAIRPLFDDRIRNDIQVILTALSLDPEVDTKIPALLAASIALTISPIPWGGPIAGARVGKVDGKLVVNPTNTERAVSDMDMLVAGTQEKLVMVEAGANEVPDDEIAIAMEEGSKELTSVIDFIEKIKSEIGKEKVDFFSEPSEKDLKTKEVEAKVDEFIKSKKDEWIFDSKKITKQERIDMVDRFSDAIKKMLEESETEESIQKNVLGKVKVYVEKYITLQILDNDQRLDGRKLDEVRDLQASVGFLPRTHGSAVFSRGDTQVISTITLASPGAAQLLDSMEEDDIKKKYMHHYNDTPASYGETGFMRGPGRRAIGHGALAERALIPVLPSEEDFPYVVRVVSEVMSSNGSSSMASTCGSTLALLDAGVPLKKSVAGIAMGLASVQSDSDPTTVGRFKVLTDLQDIEDGPGGMDFKITGTRDGVTAIQMDTKTQGLSWEIVKETFAKSKLARIQILDVIKSAIDKPKEMSPYAPRIEIVKIDPEKIGTVIGPGGKMIRQITEETGAEIDIEEDGSVFITTSDVNGMAQAVKWIEDLTHEVEAGEIYDGKVVRIENFGAFVELVPGKDGLVHVSEIAWTRTDDPNTVLNVGDIVKVKVKEIDNMNRVSLTMKELIEKPAGYVERPSSPPRDRGSRPGGFGKKPFFKK